VPGASVAEIALRHGVNSDLVFNWRKMLLSASLPITELSSSAARPPDYASPAAAGEACDFIPIGVLGQSKTVAPALMTGALSAAVGGASSHG